VHKSNKGFAHGKKGKTQLKNLVGSTFYVFVLAFDHPNSSNYVAWLI
jgi:hypothetical protein